MIFLQNKIINKFNFLTYTSLSNGEVNLIFLLIQV